MTAVKTSIHLNPILIILILGLIAFIVYLYLFINPAQVIDTIAKTNLAYFAGAFISYFLFAFFSALVWRKLLCSLSVKISIRKAVLFTWVGLFFEATVPQLGWSGEISKTYFLTKDSNQDPGKIGASVVGHKIFTITITVVALGLGLGLVLISYPLPSLETFLIALVLALSIVSIIIIYYVSLRPKTIRILLNLGIKTISFFIRKWNPQNFQLRAEIFLSQFHVGTEQLKAKPQALIKPIIYAIISFIFEVSVIFLAFLSLGYPIPIDKVLIVFTLTGTLQTVGLTFFGFPELIMSISFNALGIPAVLSVSVTLLSRIVSLWFRLIVSYSALQWAGIKIIRKKQNANLF